MDRPSAPKKTIVAALCGKGGVGKTSVSAVMVKLLTENKSSRVLAIDADPAVGLATALGIEVTRTIDDVRNTLIDEIENRTAGDRERVAALIDYEVMRALEERGNLAFLAVGRPELEGCYCQLNDLLKEVIESLAENFDYVIIDGEAGIEQINRRVMESVTHLVLVSDLSVKGLNVARTISRVARNAVRCERLGLLVNRVRHEADLAQAKLPNEIEFLGAIPEDDTIRQRDMEGKSIIDISCSPAINAVKEIINRLSWNKQKNP